MAAETGYTSGVPPRLGCCWALCCSPEVVTSRFTFDPPGGKPRRCCCSEGVASPVLCNGDQSHGRGGGPSENGTGAPSGAAAACVCLLDDGRGGRPRTPEQPGLPVDSKTPAARSRRDASGPRGTAASPPRSEQSFREGAGLRLSPRKEEPGDAHSRGRPAAADLTPLDLSHLSTRGDPGHKDLAASLQASLAVHLCPYCSHKTYYPEVLWMHQRVWHRISCTSVAPQWVQPNGHRSIRNNLVFLVRSGRTGPPPALGGRECQPLPIARFTRTQGPAGAPGPSGSCSPTAGVARATGTPRSREGHPGGPCALWTASPEGPRQTKPGHGPEQHGSLAQLPPHRPKQEAGPRPGSAGGGFSRSATPTPTVIARAGSQPPAPGRLGDKYVVPPAGAGGGPPSKHSVPEPLKAKFSPQPLGQLHAKGDGLALPASTAGPGCRGDTALQTPPTPQAARQEPPGGHEKHVDILSIFKTCIPRDFTTLYQSWGASGSAREHRGKPWGLLPATERMGPGTPAGASHELIGATPSGLLPDVSGPAASPHACVFMWGVGPSLPCRSVMGAGSFVGTSHGACTLSLLFERT